MGKSVKFCYFPWLSAQLDSSGGIKCCPSIQYNADELILQARQISEASAEEDILNSKPYLSIRKSLLSGEFPKACLACQIVENEGGKSFRMAIDEGLRAYLDKGELIASTEIDGRLRNPKIKFLELRLGRLCNLRCRFCGPESSSSWDKDFTQLYESLNTSVKDGSDYQWHRGTWFLRWLMGFIGSVENIQFAGGEPFMSPTHIKLLEAILESHLANRINLIYVTNGTMFDKNLSGLWSHFKSVQIFVSIEAIERIYEYQRWPAKWQTLLENISAFRGELGHSVLKLTIQPHINVYNIATISELAIWCLEQGESLSWNKHVNFLTNPSWQSAFILSSESKSRVQEKIQLDILKITRDFSDSPKRELILQWLRNVCQILVSKDWSNLQSEFTRLNSRLDDIRGGYLKDYLDPLGSEILNFEQRVVGQSVDQTTSTTIL